MTKEQQKDKIIEIVKKAIAENSLYDYDKESDEVIAQIDGDDLDHIAEEVAGNIYNFYHPIDEVAEYKPDEVRRFSDYGDEIRSHTRAVKELKDQIAELEKEKEETMKAWLKDREGMFWDGVREGELKGYKQLKQFAERLKEVIHERDYIQGYAEIGLIKEIDELLKEITK